MANCCPMTPTGRLLRPLFIMATVIIAACGSPVRLSGEVVDAGTANFEPDSGAGESGPDAGVVGVPDGGLGWDGGSGSADGGGAPDAGTLAGLTPCDAPKGAYVFSIKDLGKHSVIVMNDNGTALGLFESNPDLGPRPSVLDTRTMQRRDLGTQVYDWPLGLSQDGTVVGEYVLPHDPFSGGPGGSSSFSSAPDGTWRDLNQLMGHTGGDVLGITDDGTIVGNDVYAFLYRDGATRFLADVPGGYHLVVTAVGRAGDLGLLSDSGLPVLYHAGKLIPLQGVQTHAIMKAVNAHGASAGYSAQELFEGRGRTAMIWSPTGELVLDMGALFPGLSSVAASINDVGDVVGEVAGRAFLYRAGAVHYLDDDLPPAIRLIAGSAINDWGQIAVDGTCAGERHSLLLSP